MKSPVFALAFALASGCQPQPPSSVDTIAYFHSHRAEIETLARLGREHPHLRRIEPALRKFPSYYGPPTSEDLSAEAQGYDILERIKADFVAFERDGSSDDNRLYCVVVPVYRWGFSLGGVSKCLVYFPQNAPPASKAQRYVHVEGTAWYVEDSDTR